MRIRLKLFAGLRTRHDIAGRAGGGEVELDPGTTVGRALEELGVPLNQAKIILINGRHGSLETLLREGDRLSVFPPVGGG